MGELTKFTLEDDSVLVVEVEEPRQGGYELVGKSGANVPGFHEALEQIKPAANVLFETLRDLVKQPDSIEVEFGLKLSGQVGAIIASSTATG